MPTLELQQWPEPLPWAAVVRGTIRRTWPRALSSAAFLIAFYFALVSMFHIPQSVYAYGYSLGAAFGSMLIIASRTIMLWVLAKRHHVPFRILWEVVVKYQAMPAAAAVRQKAWMVRHIEAMRCEHSSELEVPED